MRTCIIDGKLITDKKILHHTLATSLDFPDWYGENLDALYDCLTDLQEDTQLIIRNSNDLETNIGTYAKSFYKVLDTSSRENPIFIWKN